MPRAADRTAIEEPATTVAGQVLELVVRAAARLSGSGYTVNAANLVSVIDNDHGPAAAELVREHFVGAGLSRPINRSQS